MMENGVNGSFTAAGDPHLPSFRSIVTYQEQYDKSANTSVLTIEADLSTTAWQGLEYNTIMEVYADGALVGSFGGSVRLRDTPGEAAQITGGPWVTQAIRHTDDGSKTINLVVVVSGRRKNQQATAAKQFSLSGSERIELTTLPASASLNAPDSDIERLCILQIKKAASTDLVSIHYQFGGLSGYITEDGGISKAEQKLTATSIPWKVPTLFYDQIPDSHFGVCKFIVTTHRDGATMPQTEENCTIRAAPDLCGPTVTGSVTDGNAATAALTGDPKKLILSASTASCTIQAEARKGASLVSRSVSGKMFGTADTLNIPEVRISRFEFSVMDSRGYTATYTVTPETIPYIPLTCNPSVSHGASSGEGKLTVTGGYYNGSFGAAENKPLFFMWKVEGSEIPAKRFDPAQSDISAGAYHVTTQITGLDYRKKTMVYVTAYDRVHPDGITNVIVVPPSIPLFDWGEHDFAFHIPVAFRAGLANLYEPEAHPGCYFRIQDGEKEWLQPPMETGKTYRTTRRFQGKPVYTRLDFGLLVPGGVSSYKIPGADTVIAYNGYVGEGRPLPLISGADPSGWVTIDTGRRGEIQVSAGSSLPEWGFYLQTWFTVSGAYKPDRSSAILGLGAIGQIILGEL